MGIDAQMLIKTKETITNDLLRERTYKLYCFFGPGKIRTWTDKFLEISSNYEQDGPDIEPEPGETFINVNLSGRYYGPGYERGDFRFIHDLAEVLEYIFPDSQIYYGGDSSGVCAEPFNKEARVKLRQHWLMNQPSPYYRSTNPFMDPTNFQDNPTCSQCQVPMQRYGFGGGNDRKSFFFYGSWSCECGEKFIIRDGVETRKSFKERENDF